MSARAAPPKLRHVQAQPISHKGRPAYVLADRFQLGANQIAIPVPLAYALNFMNGAHTAHEISQRVQAQFSASLSVDAVEDLIAALDENCLLDNARTTTAQAQKLTDFRAAPYRPPICAGSTYPDDPRKLRRALDAFITQAHNAQVDLPARALLSPHIDYARGGVTYARAWMQAREVANEAELVIIIGTDHFNGRDAFTLTHQNYASPLGVLPTDSAAVNALVDVLGEGAFRSELYHSIEHSLELPLLWLQHMRNGRPVAVLPMLVGSQNLDAPTLQRVVAVLKGFVREDKTLLVASGDLSHVGPAFDGPALDETGKARLREDDAAIMTHLKRGDADGWWNTIQAGGNRNNVCGLAPFRVALMALGSSHADALHYDICPADDAGTSVVTICGGALL